MGICSVILDVLYSFPKVVHAIIVHSHRHILYYSVAQPLLLAIAGANVKKVFSQFCLALGLEALPLPWPCQVGRPQALAKLHC